MQVARQKQPLVARLGRRIVCKRLQKIHARCPSGIKGQLVERQKGLQCTQHCVGLGCRVLSTGDADITYVELLQERNVAQGQDELLNYGAATSRLNGARILSYSVMQQLDRPNRYAVLEIWDSQTSYDTWQTLGTTTSFVAKIKPLLGSPFDHRLTILCGNTYVDNTGCTPP